MEFSLSRQAFRWISVALKVKRTTQEITRTRFSDSSMAIPENGKSAFQAAIRFLSNYKARIRIDKLPGCRNSCFYSRRYTASASFQERLWKRRKSKSCAARLVIISDLLHSLISLFFLFPPSSLITLKSATVSVVRLCIICVTSWSWRNLMSYRAAFLELIATTSLSLCETFFTSLITNVTVLCKYFFHVKTEREKILK